MHQIVLLQASVHLAQGSTVPYCALSCLTQLLITETGPAGGGPGRRQRPILSSILLHTEEAGSHPCLRRKLLMVHFH